MPQAVTLGTRVIGEGQPALIVAELSANHGGSLERALELVRLAHAAGADAVKFQTYRPDTMTIDCDAPWFRVQGGLWHGRTLWDLYTEAHTPWEWHEALFAEARRLGLLAFSTPFDASAVDYLERFEPACYKLASFEIGDIPLLAHVASTRRPVILSTGMASMAEVEEAIKTLQCGGCPAVIALSCVSAYPAAPRDFKLRNLLLLARRFGVHTGISDHSRGSLVAVAATALGARVVEKHFCRDRNDGGPDAAFSAEPAEFAELVRSVRSTESMLRGSGLGASSAEAGSLVFRRSLFAVRNIAEGELFTHENVRVIRPGHGLPPRELPRVLGHVASTTILRGTPLTWEHVANATGEAVGVGATSAASTRTPRQ
jgi:N-acetylneuraminate synthase